MAWQLRLLNYLSVPVGFFDHQIPIEWEPDLGSEQKLREAAAKSTPVSFGEDGICLTPDAVVSLSSSAQIASTSPAG